MPTVKQKTATALKAIPESFWINREQPETEDELEDFVVHVEEQYETLLTEMSGKDKKTAPLKETQKASPEEIKKILSRL